MNLEIRDLTIEYASGGSVVRPVSGLDLTRDLGLARLASRPERVRQDVAALMSRRDPDAEARHIQFGDVDVAALTGAALTAYRRHTVGIVFQAFNLVPSMSALENVMLPLCNGGVRRRKARARAGNLLEQVGLAIAPVIVRVKCRWRATARRDRAGPRVRSSAPARRRAHHAPRLHSVEGVLDLLRELAGGDRLVVIATHDQRLLPIADRVVELVPNADHATGSGTRALGVRTS